MFAIDTNVFAYAAFAKADDRKQKAVDLLVAAALADCIVPMQVMIEFGNAALKRCQLSPAITRTRIGEWSGVFQIVPTLAADVISGLALVDTAKLSYFDALILATARRAGASMLLTDDMQDGLEVAGIRVVNPFATGNAGLIAAALR